MDEKGETQRRKQSSQGHTVKEKAVILMQESG